MSFSNLVFWYQVAFYVASCYTTRIDGSLNWSQAYNTLLGGRAVLIQSIVQKTSWSKMLLFVLVTNNHLVIPSSPCIKHGRISWVYLRHIPIEQQRFFERLRDFIAPHHTVQSCLQPSWKREIMNSESVRPSKRRDWPLQRAHRISIRHDRRRTE